MSVNEKWKCLHSPSVVLYSWEFPTVIADKKKKTDSTVIHFTL